MGVYCAPYNTREVVRTKSGKRSAQLSEKHDNEKQREGKEEIKHNTKRYQSSLFPERCRRTLQFDLSEKKKKIFSFSASVEKKDCFAASSVLVCAYHIPHFRSVVKEDDSMKARKKR